MNECLGWTGNGFSDGGDIGSGSASRFYLVMILDNLLICRLLRSAKTIDTGKLGIS